MPKDLDRDELNDRDDPVPVLADDDEQQEGQQTEAGDDDANQNDDAGYDIRADMADDDRDHVLGLLSDEELAALDDDGDEDEADHHGDEDEPPVAAAEPEPPAEAGADGPPAPDPAEATAPAVDLTEDEISQINEATKAARQEALDKWKDGDLTDDDLQAAFDAADQAKEEARQAAVAAKEEARAAEAFEQVKVAFAAIARDYLTKDYPDLAKPEHLAEFDRHVRAVTTSPLYVGHTHRQMLEAAHRFYITESETLGRAAPPIAGAAAKDEAASTPRQRAPQRPAKPEVVPTLARLPAAATNATADGKWGALAARYNAATTADEREAILAPLSAEEMEAFSSMDI